MPFSFLFHKPTKLHYLILFLLAFAVRAGVFYWYIAPQERYGQPDSNDYHYTAVTMSKGLGMYRLNGQPFFWRTPGYPWYLSAFYDENQPISPHFSDYKESQQTAIWFQILLCSLLPILFFWLAYVLTNMTLIGWLMALIGIIHMGFVLASTFLLTDALASLLFILFLIFFFKSFRWSGDESLVPDGNEQNNSLNNANKSLVHHALKSIKDPHYGSLVLAALMLAAYTWLRPMGQFVALIAAVLPLFSALGWKIKIKQVALFLGVFFLAIFPWFWRNYQLTERWFFCPLFGLYLNAFNAPKILARTANIPLKEAHKRLQYDASYYIAKEQEQAAFEVSGRVVVNELVCLKSALPIITEHPGYFLYDWITEVCKTTFDLYASQLVAFAKNTFRWDPIVEYLDEKIADCLWGESQQWWMLLLAWLELISALLVWVGIFAGLWFFVAQPLIIGKRELLYSYGFLWLKTGILIGAVVMQTGGFGYARLRLPIEPLMLILGIAFWLWWFQRKDGKNTENSKVS